MSDVDASHKADLPFKDMKYTNWTILKKAEKRCRLLVWAKMLTRPNNAKALEIGFGNCLQKDSFVGETLSLKWVMWAEIGSGPKKSIR